MDGKYYKRDIEETLIKAESQFPAVVITGPRQSGKTTLLLHLYGKTHKYVTLDDPQIRAFASKDPKLFFETYSPPVIIDEIQYAPNLLPYIKMYIDEHRTRKGLFLLTGSQQFALMQGVTESLAGRTAVLTLLSMSLKESLQNSGQKSKIDSYSLAQRWIRGSFPDLVVNNNLDHNLWYSGYFQTYLERDVRTLRQVGDLGEFQAFLQAAAARNGQILSLSELSRDLGVAVNTVKAWIHILEASQQIYLVRPYYKNKGKRIIKSPKLFFSDTGIFSHLIGLNDPDYALKGPSAGALMESAVFGELIRFFTNSGKIPEIYFWRTSKGEEIDFIIEIGQNIIPIEVKLNKTPSVSFANNIEKFCELFENEAKRGYVICLAESEIPLSSKTTAVPFSWLMKFYEN